MQQTDTRAGAPAERISYGNTIKKQSDIAAAYKLGVNLFAFDSEGELEKLAASAPGARVYCRLRFERSKTADWPLGGKFGCSMEMAGDLLVRAKEMGLDPYGLSFHVGSQQRDAGQWDMALGKAATKTSTVKALGASGAPSCMAAEPTNSTKSGCSSSFIRAKGK